jgi:hypothetical protein
VPIIALRNFETAREYRRLRRPLIACKVRQRRTGRVWRGDDWRRARAPITPDFTAPRGSDGIIDQRRANRLQHSPRKRSRSATLVIASALIRGSLLLQGQNAKCPLFAQPMNSI